MSEGGSDPACWAHLLCPECGAVLEDRAAPGVRGVSGVRGEPGSCWRCGFALPPGAGDDGAEEPAGGAEDA